MVRKTKKNISVVLRAPNKLTEAKCDQACENRACGCMKFDRFFTISWLISFYDDKLWSWHFQRLLNIFLAIHQKLQNANNLFQCWVMTCNVIGCSLCPHALFSQARSQIWKALIWKSNVLILYSMTKTVKMQYTP